MNATENPAVLTPVQLDFVLCDIATHARQMDQMLGALLCGTVECLPDSVMLTALICMAQRIGWAADMAMLRSERSIGPCFGDADQWMMPPAFQLDGGTTAGPAQP